LGAFFWNDRFRFTVRSETLPSVERTFERFSAAADEASVSRVFAGVHFGFDETTGDRMGRRIARFALIKYVWPWHRPHDEQDEHEAHEEGEGEEKETDEARVTVRH
jgi:hypothetical protein